MLPSIEPQAQLAESSPGANGPDSPGFDQSLRSPLGRGLPVRITTSALNVFGTIQDILPNSVSILSKQCFAKGTSISIEFGSAKLAGRVASCCTNGSRYEACVAISNRQQCDLRVAQRFPVSKVVQVHPASSESNVDGLITDLSAKGVGLEAPCLLEVGETVTIEGEFHAAFGVVRHCTPLRDGSYHAGLEVFHIMPREPAPAKNPHKVSVLEGLFPDYS
jgi:hypothetical protein